MEAMLANYGTTIQLIDNDLARSNEEFKKQMEMSNENKNKRMKSILKTTLTMMKSPGNVQETPDDSSGKTWWEQFKDSGYPDDQCFEFFRCSRVPVDKQIAAVLSKISNRDTFGRLSAKFSLYKPTLIGIIDTLHIPICNAYGMADAFTNSKNYYSFRDVSIRFPGARTDIEILQDSNIYRLHEKVIPPETQSINGMEIPYYVIGPRSYPLLSWLLTEYPMATTNSDLLFNSHIEAASQLRKTAIERMRARFDILNYPIDVNIGILPQLIGCCFALHNICERHGDFLSDERIKSSLIVASNYEQPEKVPYTDKNMCLKGVNQRDCIRNYFVRLDDIDQSTFGYMDYESIDFLTEEVV
ncbi:Similar to At3g55350: Protein ALP1-like (Arabidopsis thaliana) [Cotesia congregata]|uniref:Similar to At3g55350: Protein ALP1-like (Arabidopsis thaliana) n=1 Tax=Cotesia congregata TaxID=51543 RepID=A0A8J2HRD6_COTCN|nr:Similar to At3g55350: Protein ALP1-like (Arabidopsis thaliana) [Cotesia congregata]